MPAFVGGKGVTVTGLAHTDAADLTTLRWGPVAGARGYVVAVSGHGACPADEEVVAGSTTDAADLTLRSSTTSGGTYRVRAINNVGAGTYSAAHTVVPPDDDVSGPVVVTNEGDPPICHPDHPAYQETGTWAPSALPGFDASRTRFSREGGATATWRATVPAGAHDVAAWFPKDAICPDDTTYPVRQAGGATEVAVDECATGGGWHSLGTFDLADGLASDTLTAGGGTVRADAVRFSPDQ